MLKIVHQRLVTKAEENVGAEKFGFRRGMGTIDATEC